MYSFPDLELVCCSKSSSNYCLLTCIQISQEAGQVVWYSHLLKNCPQFIVIHTVKGFGIVNKSEVGVFLELSCWFLECQRSLLPSPVWPLTICLDSWTWHSRLILLFTASNLASITSHIHSWVLFLLWLHPFILSGVISPLISSSILGTYWPGEILFQYPIILPFHTAHEVLKARIPKRFAIPFSSGPHSVSYIYFIKLNEFPGSVPVPDFPVYDSGHFSPAALHASLFLFILNSAIYLLSHIVVSAWRYEFSHGH